ncbi:ABC transporter ATP-binding protein [Hazenella sp. IB182357]|uniref:ABC transporter ATP-binding protein n=1 Tax=Polycladospora coralii TaxID=2771432 RepID=A0A926RT89_9BACL|nr:ABC transporter ATP-binding protein [Polycladospora coralii]MBD1370844.1 ABC transporter ATP-binding protein [Polycladospora coralii]MBS7529783.1 ABC transporter ATP-binding protein [Polycladospora coralii]
MSVLVAKQVTKTYGQAGIGVPYQALKGIDLTVNKGEFVGIMGPSGSGKSTLLQILGSIEQATTGDVYIQNQHLDELTDVNRAQFRKSHLGFIFQDFQLLDFLTVEENMHLPLALNQIKHKDSQQKIAKMADILGVREILKHRPHELSGGQKQRVAAARALIHTPAVVLADEPTGNLDSKSAKSLMQALVKLNQQELATIVMVTHDPYTASFCDRVVVIKDGQLFHELYAEKERSRFHQRIVHVMTALGGEHDALSYLG